MFKDIVAASRSCRRFHEADRVSHDLLVDWVDTARLAPSSGNRQPLKYLIVSDPETCESVFSCLSWAAALPDWEGPEKGERPSGYIVITHDDALALGERFTAWDEGIAAQTIMLAAKSAGYGSCPIGAFRKRSLAEALGIDCDVLEPDLVIALGKPKEETVISDMPEDGSPAYWRDENHVHHVPKRPLKDVLLG